MTLDEDFLRLYRAVQAFRNLPRLGKLHRLRRTSEYSELCRAWEACDDRIDPDPDQKKEKLLKARMKIEVEGVELTVEQTLMGKRVYIKVNRTVGRDRKRKIDITGGIETEMGDASDFIRVLKQVAKLRTARCSCDYRYGFSDHAEHCESIYVAQDSRGYLDDD
jgi:hypothetical protein